MIQGYLSRREQLVCTFVLIDSNIPPQTIDIEFINWMGETGLPFVLVYTKTDRLSKPVLERNLAAIRAAVLEHWHELPKEFISSAVTFDGKHELLDFIDTVQKSIQP